jgi:Uma2 family endonuclease
VTLAAPYAPSKLAPGSTGWTLADLDNDPVAARFWDSGHFEIIEGVIAATPPVDFESCSALQILSFQMTNFLSARGESWLAGPGADLVLSNARVVRPDMVFLSPADLRRQKAAHSKRGKGKELTYGRILIAPTLIIESLSMDHELHDTDTKRRWFAEAGVPNYWLLNAYTKTLDCLILAGGAYRTDASGKKSATLRPAAFPDLVISLAQLWG